MTNHPSDETLAAFVDGRLDEPTRRNVVEHMASCDDCYADWQAVAEFGALGIAEPEEAESEGAAVVVPHRRSQPKWLFAAAAAVLAVVVALGPLREGIFGGNDIEKLVEASQSLEVRPNESRLSGGFPHRELKGTFRSGDGEAEPSFEPGEMAITVVAAEVDQKAGNKPSAEELHTLAVAHVLLGKFDKAVGAAERALRAETGETNVTTAIAKSKNAELVNDLAAAYYARGRFHDERKDYLQAYEAANRARALASTPEILWNRALALQALGMMEDARIAWREYLNVEKDPAWIEEANRKVADLDEQVRHADPVAFRNRLMASLRAGDDAATRALVQTHRTDARMFAEDHLFPSWARAEAQSPGKDEDLRIIQRLGDALQRVSGDRLTLDAATAAADARPNERRLLATAHADYAAARERSRREPSAAIALFSDVAQRFERARSPFHYLARMRQAGCLQRSAAYDETLRVVDGLAPPESLAERGYYALAAQVEWTRGVTLIELHLPDRSLKSYERALVWFGRLGERPNEAIVRSLAAQAADRIGESDVALRYRLEGLHFRGSSTESLNQRQVLLEAGMGLSAAGYVGTADVVLNRLVAIDRAGGDPNQLCTALLWRSFHRSQSERLADASTDFAGAETVCNRVTDPKVRARIAENQAVVADALDRDGDDALRNLTGAIEFANRTGNRFRSAVLYSKRATAHLRAHALAAAQADARTALEQIDGQWQRVDQPRLRESFLESVRQIVSRSIEVSLAAGDLQASLDAAEWQRSRVNFGVPAVRPDLARLRSGLDDDAALLAYHLGPDRLTIITIRKSAAEARSIAVSRASLAGDVASLRTAVLRNDSQAIRGRAHSLYKIVVSPIQPLLRDIRTLLIVPDGPLASLPFALLTDDAGRYLVQTFKLVFLPSVAAGAGTPCRTHTVGDALLVAGLPRIDPKNETPLTAVDPELRDLTTFYPGARVLRDHDAAPESFLDAAEGAAIIHFAGHAVANEVQPMLSALVLPSREDGKPGYLYAHQIASHPLRNCRLVMLSGCRTGNPGPASRAPGSIAQAFLSAGAHAVIGTLWDVEDRFARETARSVHKSVAAGATAAEAVRATQLEMLNHAPAQAWASLTAMGGCDGRERPKKG